FRAATSMPSARRWRAAWRKRHRGRKIRRSFPVYLDSTGSRWHRDVGLPAARIVESEGALAVAGVRYHQYPARYQRRATRGGKTKRFQDAPKKAVADPSTTVAAR